MAVTCCGAGSALALDGANELELTTFNGWEAFEIVTQSDDIGAISDAGYGGAATRGNYDGLGGFIDSGSLSIYMNHETSGAAISRVQVDLAGFRQALRSIADSGATPFPASFVTRMGYGYDKIYDGTYHAVSNPEPVAFGTAAVAAYGGDHFDRFCSATSYLPDAYGAGRGFVDPIYITGEEVPGGKFYAIDPTGDALWEVPDLGLGSWENAAPVDTGNTTHTAMILSSDVGTGSGDYLRLYVGRKAVDANADGAIDFLERNGLRGGTVYHFDPDGSASTTDLPDGTVAGTWGTSTAGALRETKFEDVHTNPLDGTQLVIADQTDGIYKIDLHLPFTGGDFDHATATAVIIQIDDNDVAPIGAPDNLTWSANGKVYVQEDGDGNDMWQINPDGGGRVQLAHAFSEPSGVYDVSGLVGFLPGSVLLTSIQGDGPTGAQLIAMVSPDARLSGDLDGDGFVGITDLNTVLGNWSTNVTAGDLLQGDASGDGFVGIEDLNVVLGNWNVGPPPASSVPEPATAVTLAALGALCRQHRKPSRASA